ncbi:hypothetical protein FB381_1538 [Nocardioides albertanoniae]|uniref:Uncharacterized protein n=1 Tax=Nocardioides albertanoniae TaxID=1175486 RepID=A0A543A595_9ACTN|nr:hypothetical protein FB381_1538 [Nocardioides albertanoniae]
MFVGLFAADPYGKGVLGIVRSKGRPAAAGFAGRFAVLDTGRYREFWLSIGSAAGVWHGMFGLGAGLRMGHVWLPAEAVAGSLY